MSKFKYLFLIFFIVLVYGVVNFVVLRLDKTSPTYDELGYWLHAESIHQYLVREVHTFAGLFSGKTYSYLVNIGDRSRPPLYPLFLSLFFFMSHDIDMVKMANLFYLSILLMSVYGIGSIVRGPPMGAFAASLLALFPGIFGMSRVLMVDFSLLAIIGLWSFLLIKTEHFSHVWYTLGCGIVAGLGMLTKTSFIIYMLPIFIGYVTIAVYKGAFFNRERESISRIVLFFFLCGLCSAAWYIPNWGIIVARARTMALDWMTPDPGFWFYFNMLEGYILSWGCVGVIIALCVCVLRKQYLLAVWFLCPVILLSFSNNKCPRFIVPILPAAALMIAWVIDSLRNKFMKIVAVTSSLTVFFLSSVLIHAGLLKNTALGMSPTYYYSDATINLGITSPRSDVDWRIDELVSSIDSRIVLNMDMSQNIRVLFVFNIGEISGPFEYFAHIKNIPIRAECPAQGDFFDQEDVRSFYRKGGVSQYDVVVMKDGFQGENRGGVAWIEILGEDFRVNQKDFVLVEVVDKLPDQSRMMVYLNKKTARQRGAQS